MTNWEKAVQLWPKGKVTRLVFHYDGSEGNRDVIGGYAYRGKARLLVPKIPKRFYAAAKQAALEIVDEHFPGWYRTLYGAAGRVEFTVAGRRARVCHRIRRKRGGTVRELTLAWRADHARTDPEGG